MRHRPGIILLLLVLIATPSAFALVSVSQLGYHPSGAKAVTVYTQAQSGTYSIIDTGGNTVRTGSLAKPTDYWGAAVSCQGGQACLTGDFSSFTTPGTYRITTSTGETSAQFTISQNVYRNALPLFNEFFDAQSMRNSSYHADMDKFADPPFLAMFDGSFIMTSQQASVAAIRMADAYRKNPAALSSDTRTFIRPGTPDLVEHIMLYTEYLSQLQDAVVQDQAGGYRTGTNVGAGISPDFVFVPGPTSVTSINIYSGGGSYVQSLPVKSLCGTLSGSAYTACINDAAALYKCQADEYCMQQTYKGPTAARAAGVKASRGVPVGWFYEWNCYVDINLQGGNFNANNQPNSCMIFDRTENNENTAAALLAYAEAIPVINQYDNAKAVALLGRAVQTQRYLKPGALSLASDGAGYFGAASFLLYDLTGNSTYLDDAYSVRAGVSTTLVADQTHGNEYYWQEYIRHRTALSSAGKTYLVNGADPAEFFNGKIWGDYKDAGLRSISATGERVYRLDDNYNFPIVFQNSRFMLTEGLFAAKTKELYPGTATLVQGVADSQLAWVTGNNGVDTDLGNGQSINSVSFIYGIGSFPTQYHSRLLMDSGYSGAQSSLGQVIGMHGNDFTWYNGSGYTYFDGRTFILNNQLGSEGNKYHGETSTPQLTPKTFTNGKTYIPGWISGAYDVNYDPDTIMDFRDDRKAFEFTETTAEIVSTAVALFAYNDANYNGAAPLATPLLGNPSGGGGGGGNPPPNGSTCYNSVQNIPAACTGGSITQDTFDGCRHLVCASGASSMQVLACDKGSNFEMYKQFQAGSAVSQICIGSTCIADSGFAASGSFPICAGSGGNPPPVTCSYNGAAYAPGQAFPKGDACNTCVCGTNGAVTCTATSCNPQPNGTACYSDVKAIPPTCSGGTITVDSVLGNGCRSIVCVSGANALQVQACNKPGDYQPQYFEMFKQTTAGTPPTICLGVTCVGTSSGFARSGNYPVCTGGTPPPPSGSSATLSVAPWFPQGRNYVFLCNADSFTATSYDFSFGDGQSIANHNQDNVWHTYAAAGNYNVACTAKSGGTSATGTLTVAVS